VAVTTTADGSVFVNGSFVGNFNSDPSLLQASEAELQGRVGTTSGSVLAMTPDQPLVPDVFQEPEEFGFDPNIPHQPSTFHPEPHGDAAALAAWQAQADANMGAGDDLRDVAVGGVLASPLPQVSGVIALGVLLARLGPVAGAAIRRFVGAFARGTVVRWDQLPNWAKVILTGVGLAGTDIALDIPGIPGDSLILDIFGGNGSGGHPGEHLAEGHVGPHVVGSWVANGVKFYRLSDGKLAVQNKLGRWKVWKPKKPIVLFADGAGSLKTMLRADAALNKQAKKIAAMLNRRAPRKSRAAAKKDSPTVILNRTGQVVDV